MANSSYLNNNTPSPDLRDWQHAARLFSDNTQIYGPKQKFLFHVAISINPNAVRTPILINNFKSVIGMLVKSVSLPKYTATVEKANQYNRKKNIQNKISYEDSTIRFHDDNMGLINLMWQNYFNYYNSDTTSASIPGAYNRTATRNFSFTRAPYGLDSGATDPFFNYITIYQMAQGQYVSYKLINPIITSWSHETVDYSQSQQPHENVMTLAFEAVEYGQGSVVPGDPEGFGVELYDQSPSPLSAINPLSTVADINNQPSIANANTTFNNKSSFVDTAIQQVNNYQNQKGTVSTSASGTLDLSNINSTKTQSSGSASNIVIPTRNSANTTAGYNTSTTIAKPSKLT
jgi:hypothetical protein